MKKLNMIAYYWLPPLLWMIIIFYFSSQPRTTISHQYFIDFAIYKVLHMLGYALLYLLLFRALYQFRNFGLSLQDTFLYSALIAVIYAISDEIHQRFVPTREGRLRDVMIDSLGILLMYIYIKNHLKFIKKIIT